MRYKSLSKYMLIPVPNANFWHEKIRNDCVKIICRECLSKNPGITRAYRVEPTVPDLLCESGDCNEYGEYVLLDIHMALKKGINSKQVKKWYNSYVKV